MTPDPIIAAIDQGSSSTKGALVDGNGHRLEEISLPIGTDSSGQTVRHDPEEIAATVVTILDRLLERPAVAAIGLTCQRSTCLLWDRESGKSLTPALSWQDTSQSRHLGEFSRHAVTIAHDTGLRLSPHYAAAKLASLIGDLPRGRERAESGEIVAGTLDAFLVRRLTGRDGTEPGQAGRTLLLDLETVSWSSKLTEIFGIPLASLPPLRSSAGDWGGYQGVPLTAVAGDQQAALVGHGGWRQGTVAAHFGTGAFVLAATGTQLLRLDKALSAVVASTDSGARFQLEASVNSAGSAVDWARRLTGEDLEQWQDSEIDPETLPLVFPAFRGAGAPWWKPDAQPVISGLNIQNAKAQLLGGTVAGVAMRVLDCVDLLSQAIDVESLRVSGKLTRLRGLTGLLADASGMPVEIAQDEEVGLLGVARLARAGLDGDEQRLSAPPPLAERRDPRWPGHRILRIRERWHRFSRAALDLASIQ